ncbi:MAG: FlgD immunoglobulin-like domain containing protein [Elusimicrobiota bacterium]|nr:FlgD immunoglobulin-like domain containing protein [Elusimicrobiota bacterium]
MSATFATLGQELGPWDLTVTNADGVPAVKANAIVIDFAPGTVTLTDNLLRPRNGGATVIDVETFDSGRVSARVYAADGRPIRTLFDGEQAEGSFGFTWDGKDASGAVVPSGLYFVAVNGPKIAIKGKIVVIR